MTDSLMKKHDHRYPYKIDDDGSKSTGVEVDVEDDDLNEPDEDDEDLRTFVLEDEEEEGPEEEGPEEEGEPEKGESGSEEDKESEKKGRVFTQEELDRIISERLARERRKLEEEKALADVQARQQQEVTNYLGKVYADKLQFYINLGFGEDVAKPLAEEAVRAEERSLRLEAELQAKRQHDEQMAKMMRYNSEKSEFIAKQPLAAKYAKEIDAVSKYGAISDFETAYYYVLGQKAASGELSKKIKEGTEQKVLADVQKRRKIAVEHGGLSSGESEQVSLSRTQLKLAKVLGVSPKEWADQLAKQKKKRL